MKAIYSKDTSAEATVKVEGYRGSWVYVTFLDGPSEGITCPCPAGWLTFP